MVILDLKKVYVHYFILIFVNRLPMRRSRIQWEYALHAGISLY